MSDHDPIALEIIQNALQAAADEMFAAMRKTAMSSIIYEVLDMGTGVLDARGGIACSGAGIPAFVGVLDKAVKVIVARFEGRGIRPGDIFATNDPYHGGVTHLNDIVVAMPVFAEGRIVAWTANIAHNSDVGGMAPGSLSGEATEIFQEGLRLPGIRIVEAGEPIRPVFEIIKANSRMPEVLEGDVWAAIASVRVGARRLNEIASKHGADAFERAMATFMDYGEAASRRAMADLPKGVFELSSGAGIPTFVGVLDKAVARLLEIHGADGPRPGDVFVTNDPYHGGVTHLSDVVVALPVFARGERVAWAATIAHWSDVGGRTPGSMAADATDIHQEGLRLPAIRLFDGGRLVEPVLAVIEANLRQPGVARGDLWAQVAACRRAKARIRALVERHGPPAFRDALRDAFDTAEAQVRAGLRGSRAAGSRSRRSRTTARPGGRPWRWGRKPSTVDLRGNPAQLGLPRNLSRDGAVIAAQMILKATADPALDANAGSFRPLRVLTEPGTVFHALPPAPHGYYFETRIRLYDLLWRCLAQAAPERLPAGHFGTIFGTVIAGRHPDTGRRFTMVEPQMGGWGATAERDGLDAMHSASHGDTFACPRPRSPRHATVSRSCAGRSWTKPGAPGGTAAGEELGRSTACAHRRCSRWAAAAAACRSGVRAVGNLADATASR